MLSATTLEDLPETARAQTSPAAPPPAAAAGPGPTTRTWASRHLALEAEEPAARSMARAGLGLSLAGLYGAALGLGGDALSLWDHATLVIAQLVAVVLLAVPALFILLSLCDAAVSASSALAVSSHALFRVGLLLASVAPVLALYATTTERATTLTIGIAAYHLAALVGLRFTVLRFMTCLPAARPRTRALGGAAIAGFALFAVLLVAHLEDDFFALGGC